jgi:hypothetical protein
MQRLNSILSLVFMLLALAAAYLLDRWLFVERRAFSGSFEAGPWLRALVVSGLILVAVWALLAFWILKRSSGWIVPSAFILVGLGILLYPPLRALSGWPIFRPPMPFFSAGDRLAYTGAFIAVLGILNWILAGRKRSR